MAHVDAADVEWSETEHGDANFRRKQLGAAAGGEELGCSLYELPSGSDAWPYHYHEGNEESLFVLDGSGRLRLDGEERPLDAGDYVALPAGEGSAHAVANDGPEPLRYLVVSTMDEPDVTAYPDSDTFGVFAGSAPGSPEARSLHGFYRREDDVDFWEEVACSDDDG
jgi:uncharacterized cupin superfamily protein